jgi:hypothetical protein
MPTLEMPSQPIRADFFSRVERLATPVAIGFSLVAFIRFAISSSRRLWFDEIYTAAVALQPTWIDVWKAYMAPVDLQSPLFYGLSRISWQLLGRNELALRMPEILGVLVFGWCMYLFIGKRLGPLFGLCAMILPLVTNVELCADQARPYGILLGACGLAMLAWRNAVENPKRRTSLVLFAGSLALVVACHGYAIVVILAFALAEFFRAWRSRRLDWRLWLCFLAVLVPLPPYWYTQHVIGRLNGVMGPSKWSHWSQILGFYQFFFQTRENVLILFGLLLVGLALLRKGPKPRRTGMPGHEIVLSVMLATSPVFSVALAMFTTRYYMARYSIFAMGGVVVLAILLIDWVAPDRRIASLMLLLSSLFLFGTRFSDVSMDAVRKRDAAIMVPFAQIPPGTPLVIASGLALLPTDVYASDAQLANTYYLSDRAAAIRYTGSTVFEFPAAFTDYHHFRVHVEDYGSFVKTHKKFMVYGNYLWDDDWQLRKLRDDGARMVEKGKYEGEAVDNFLVEVTLP